MTTSRRQLSCLKAVQLTAKLSEPTKVSVAPLAAALAAAETETTTDVAKTDENATREDAKPSVEQGANSSATQPSQEKDSLSADSAAAATTSEKNGSDEKGSTSAQEAKDEKTEAEGPIPSSSMHSINKTLAAAVAAAAAASAAAAATPTTPVNSFGNNENRGSVKRGLMLIGFAPVKKKRTYYVVLSSRALEFHDSEKAYKKGSTSKHIVDLATAFNVHTDHYDPKMKKCICLMEPDDTILLRVDDKDEMQAWYEAFLNSMVTARRLRLGRPISSNEIFEAAWDIEVVLHTGNLSKYNKSQEKLGYTNICHKMKELLGPKRLCFYSHTVILANRQIEPTNFGCPDTGFPPFRTDSIIEFPRPHIAFFGCHDRYFFLRLGQGLAIGGSELLVQCDTREVSTAIHQKMSAIIEREAGKRARMSMPILTNGVHVIDGQTIHSTLRSGHKSQFALWSQPSPGMESLSVPSPNMHHRSNLSLNNTPVMSAKDRRLLLRDCLSFTNSLERDDSAPSSPFGNGNRPRGSLGNFQIDYLSRPRRTSNVIRMVREEPGLREMMALQAPKISSAGSEKSTAENASRKSSLANSEKTIGSRTDLQSTPTSLPTSDYTIVDCSTRKLSNGTPMKKIEESEASIKRKKLTLNLPTNSDYERMLPTDWDYSSTTKSIVPIEADHVKKTYKLDPVRAYFSESTDSCYSSTTNSNNTIEKSDDAVYTPITAACTSRAYSFGGTIPSGYTPLKPEKETKSKKKDKDKPKDKGASSSKQLEVPKEDERKRSFSLGMFSVKNTPSIRGSLSSLSNFMGLNEFRRLVKKDKNPSASPNNSSGLSLNSSNPSPSTSSNNFLESAEDKQNRTASFGSGKSSPHGKAVTSPTAKIDDDYTMMIDFTTMQISKPAEGTSSSSDPKPEDDTEEIDTSIIDMRPIRPSDKAIAVYRLTKEGQKLPPDPTSYRSSRTYSGSNNGSSRQNGWPKPQRPGKKTAIPNPYSDDFTMKHERDGVFGKSSGKFMGYFSTRISSISEENEEVVEVEPGTVYHIMRKEDDYDEFDEPDDDKNIPSTSTGYRGSGHQ